MTDRELMHQALDALEKTKPEISKGSLDVLTHDAAITALRDRLAQPEQEPVAYIRVSKTGHVMACAKSKKFDELPDKTLLYTAPPQRQWVGLTDEDIFSVLTNLQEMYNRPPTTDSRVIFAYAIERKLKEKNDR